MVSHMFVSLSDSQSFDHRIRELNGLNYIVAKQLVDSSPRLPVSRLRAFLPCVRVPSGSLDVSDRRCEAAVEIAESLMVGTKLRP